MHDNLLTYTLFFFNSTDFISASENCKKNYVALLLFLSHSCGDISRVIYYAISRLMKISTIFVIFTKYKYELSRII